MVYKVVGLLSVSGSSRGTFFLEVSRKIRISLKPWKGEKTRAAE